MLNRWPKQIRDLIEHHPSNIISIYGGPGTGKTTLLTDIATHYITSGGNIDTVMFLTGQGKPRLAQRAAFTQALFRASPASVPAIGANPIRSVHSYAFSVLQRAAQRREIAPPRLVTRREQIEIIRELLIGEHHYWPEELHPALYTDSFLNELADLMARCYERYLDPTELAQIGRRYHHDEWISAGYLSQQYEQIMLLRAAVGIESPTDTIPALTAAELIGAAWEALLSDSSLLEYECRRIRLLLIDDAQQLDRQAGELIRLLASRIQRTIIASDPNQAVYGFRGGSSHFFDIANPNISLTESYRCHPRITQAINAMTQRLPGTDSIRHIQAHHSDSGTIQLITVDSERNQTTYILNAVRRAHLIHGIPWSQMAILLRSITHTGTGIAQALTSENIPLHSPDITSPLLHQPAVDALITILKTLNSSLTPYQMQHLLTGPFGGIDPISFRQLTRILIGHSEDQKRLCHLLMEEETLPSSYELPIRRIRKMLHTAQRSYRNNPHDLYQVLWDIWSSSQQEHYWLTMIQHGGASKRQAKRHLRAISDLCQATSDYYELFAHCASIEGLIQYLAHYSTYPYSNPDSEAIQLLTVHGALGQQWKLVIIAGLQEGLWPNLTPRGGLLHTQQLLDILDNIDEQVSLQAPLLAEERRLFLAAMARAQQHLIITAINTTEAEDYLAPSLFFTELQSAIKVSPHDNCDFSGYIPSLLTSAAVISRLRAQLCQSDVDSVQQQGAALQLARLAQAHIAGADPSSWWELTPISTTQSLISHHGTITLSVSALQTLLECPLRWFMEYHGGTYPYDLPRLLGSLLHSLFTQLPQGNQMMINQLHQFWSHLPFQAQWYSDNELLRHQDMLTTAHQWYLQTRHSLSEVATEISFSGVLPGITPTLSLHGRIDRLERDQLGQLVVIDIKTSKTPISKQDAQQHPQLACYQLAIQSGLLPYGDQCGGAELLYPAKPTRTHSSQTRHQTPLSDDDRHIWNTTISNALQFLSQSRFPARINSHCRHCSIRSFCPAYHQL